MTQTLSFVPLSLYIPTYAVTLGLSRLDGNAALSLFNAASTGAQFGVGYLCDRSDYAAINVVSCCLAGLVAFVLFGVAANSLSTVLVRCSLHPFSGQRST